MADFAIGGTMLDGCFYPRSLLFHNSFATLSLPLRSLLLIFHAHFLLLFHYSSLLLHYQFATLLLLFLFLFPFAPSSTQTTTQKKAEPLSDSA